MLEFCGPLSSFRPEVFSQVSKMPDVYLDEFRPDYMPPAIPSDIAEELISYHKAPEVGVIIQNEFKMTRGIIEFEYYTFL